MNTAAPENHADTVRGIRALASSSLFYASVVVPIVLLRYLASTRQLSATQMPELLGELTGIDAPRSSLIFSAVALVWAAVFVLITRLGGTIWRSECVPPPADEGTESDSRSGPRPVVRSWPDEDNSVVGGPHPLLKSLVGVGPLLVWIAFCTPDRWLPQLGQVSRVELQGDAFLLVIFAAAALGWAQQSFLLRHSWAGLRERVGALAVPSLLLVVVPWYADLGTPLATLFLALWIHSSAKMHDRGLPLWPLEAGLAVIFAATAAEWFS